MSWQPEGEIVISTSSEFMDFDTLLETIKNDSLTGYLSIESPTPCMLFFSGGVPMTDVAAVKEKVGAAPYVAFFNQLPMPLLNLCWDISESREILSEQFKFVYEIYYFSRKVANTNFRGALMLRKGGSYFLIYEDGEPILGIRWAGGTFEARSSLVDDIFALGGEAEEVHVFRRIDPFTHFEPKEMIEKSGVKNVLFLFARFFSSLRTAFFGTRPVLRAIYYPKIEDFASLSRLKSQAQSVYLARGYARDPTKTMQNVNEFWDIFYKYPKKANNALFLFGRSGIPSNYLFSEETTNIDESLTPASILARLGLTYETRPLGDLMEDMSAQKLKTLLEIYNIASPSEKSLRNLKQEVVIKTVSSR